MSILNIKGSFPSLPMLKQIADRKPKKVFGVKWGTIEPTDQIS